MADLDDLLTRIADSNKRLDRIDADRAEVKKQRDADLLEAKAAGATWANLLATGMSRATIAKILDL